MFKRKVHTIKTLELSDETKQALTSLENDLQVLVEMQREVITQGRQILGALTGQIADEVETEEYTPEVGVRVFEDDEDWTPLTTEGTPRKRRSAFKRRPLHEQYQELLELLSDGEWHNCYTEAKKIAGDEREFRYLRAAIGGRFKEMYDEGKLERKDCELRGAMFSYRLKGGK